jgi:hypothetical protein
MITGFPAVGVGFGRERSACISMENERKIQVTCDNHQMEAVVMM